MNIIKALFGGREETAEETEQRKLDKKFDILKYDGVRALQSGQPDYAVRCFTEALKLKDEEQTESCLAQAYLQTGQTEEAYDTLCRLSGRIPENIPVLLSKARVALRLNRPDEAAGACRAVLALDGQNTEGHYRLAEAQRAAGDVLNAIASVTTAITLHPELEEAYRLRAEILQDMGQATEAEADADHLLEHFPPTEETLMLKAGLRLALGDTDNAVAYYNKVKDTNPFNEKAYICLSAAHAAGRRMDASLQVLEEGLELMPQAAGLYKERGRIKLALGDKEGATDDLKKALELSPEEAQRVEGQFSNLSREMEARYKSQNPYGF